MPLILLRDDITNIKCDVIVNATNTRLSLGAYREFYLSNAQADAKVDGKLKLVDEIEATHIGCEYGENDE